MSERELGPEHPDVAATVSDLAYLLTGEGAYKEAEQFVDESLAIRRKVLGDENPKVGSALCVKANLLLAMRRYEEAGRTAAEARRILELSLPQADWQVAMAKNLQGAAFLGLRDYAGAEPLLLASLGGLSGAALPGLETQGRGRLAELYIILGKYAEAKKYAGT